MKEEVEVVYSNPYFSVIKNDRYHYLEEVGGDNAAVILVKVGPNFLFVRHTRIAQRADLLEAPRGSGKKGERSAQAAIRELMQETGLRAEPSRVRRLGRVAPNSAILASTVTVFLAEIDEQALHGARPNVKEGIRELSLIPVSAIQQAVASGSIIDGLTLSALSLYHAVTAAS